MFTTIKSILKNYIADVDAMKLVLLDQKKQCYEKKEYTTVFKDKMYSEIKNKYDSDRMECKAKALEELDAAFTEIFEKLEESVTSDIGQDSIAELQILCDIPVSEFEINAYAKKYSGKFKALKLINNAAKKANIPFSFVSDIEIVDELNNLKADIHSFLNQYQGVILSLSLYSSQYIYMCLNGTVEEKDNIFNQIEAKFNDFLLPSVKAGNDD